MSSLRTTHWLILTMIGLAIVFTGSLFVTGTEVRGDARENLQMALNLQRHGIVSLDSEPPLRPSMFREPVPIAVMAAAIGILDRFQGPSESADYYKGERVQLLKSQDLLWLLALYVTAFWTIGLFSKSFTLRLAGAILVCIPYLAGGSNAHGGLDKLYTDVLASFLLLVSSAVLVRAARSQQVGFSILAGVLFALLALTKAAVLYIFVGVLCVFGIYLALTRGRMPARRRGVQVIAVAVAFLVATFPWMYRNHQHFDAYQIAERGGPVLMTRAIKNLMTPVEYRGTFYAWAPREIKPVMRRVLGFRNEDLEAGGRLARLNRSDRSSFYLTDQAADLAGQPENATSYFRKSLAEYSKLKLEYQAAGVPNPTMSADKEIRRRAMTLIKEHPWRHLAMIPPFLWRGAFYSFPVLLIVLIHSIRQQRYDLALFVAPAFGAIMFYALLSHFIPRYGQPLGPAATVAAVLFAKAWWDQRATRTRLITEPPSSQRLETQNRRAA